MESNKKGSGMIIGIIVTLFILIVLFFTFSEKVPVGYTAIKVDVYGKEVEPEGLHTGRNFVNVITHDVFKYPIFIQQMEYLDLRFQDKDGLVVTADI
jgi:regulator of protease activity HflC (stomatin/prohibitin superfamily)